MIQPVRIMIDMETAGTGEGSAILTLGACTFGLPFSAPRNHFYQRASLASNEQAGRNISKSTMEWWDKQDPAMRQEAFSGTATINELLANFETWALNLGAELKDVELWSRGAGFDCNILQHAYENLHGSYPFDFRKHMCQRTVESLMPEGLKELLPKNLSKHHALQDAIHQANVIDTALNNIRWYTDSRYLLAGA